MSDAAIIAIVSAITTLAGFYFQGRMMDRKFKQGEAAAEKRRLWAKEDAEVTAQRLAEKTEQTAAELKQETQVNRRTFEKHVDVLNEKLDRNTELTGMAYNAANNFELKLERLAKVFDSVHTDREIQRQLVELASDTNTVVHDEIQPDLHAIKERVTRDDGPAREG